MRQNPDEDSEMKQQQQQPKFLKLQLGEKVHISRECKGDFINLKYPLKVAAVSCVADVYRLGGVKLGIW